MRGTGMVGRRALLAAAAGLLAAGARTDTARGAATPELVVYKNPWCGCCEGWARHMEAAGFAVRREEVDDLGPVKRTAGVPPRLAACHTAVVAGLVVEGHVPAAAVRRLLAERPAGVRGVAAPGMPAGSPGMPAPEPETYTLHLFTADGRILPWLRARGAELLGRGGGPPGGP